jgi:hypothetical protein
LQETKHVNYFTPWAAESRFVRPLPIACAIPHNPPSASESSAGGFSDLSD